MTAPDLIRHWNRFFFAPVSPTPIALYRILYGVLNIANIMLMHRDWLTWFGRHGAVTLETITRANAGVAPTATWPVVSIFRFLPTDRAITAFYWVFLLIALCVTVGVLTRVTVIGLYLCLLSIQARNPFILSGADQLLLVTGFFLMFAPTDAAFSVDRLWRIWRGTEGITIAPRPPWAQRMIQLQVSLMYIGTVWFKTLGHTWLDGTAVYYAVQRADFKRFAVPGIQNLLFVRFASWLTLVTEFAAGTVIWLRDLRYPVLIAVVLLHFGIDYAMILPLFEWIAIATLVTFIYPEDLARVWSWIRWHVGPWLGAPVTLVYDGASMRAARSARVLRAADIFGRLLAVDLHSGLAGPLPPQAAARAGHGRLIALADGSVRSGFAAWCTIAPRVPLLWPLLPFSLFMPQPTTAVPAAPTIP